MDLHKRMRELKKSLARQFEESRKESEKIERLRAQMEKDREDIRALLERAEAPAARLADIRWATTGTTKAHADAARENGKRGGRPKLPRCPCGAMTRNRAKARNHRCHSVSPAM
jgi:hypothetical protein